MCCVWVGWWRGCGRSVMYVCVCHTEEGGMGGMGVCKCLWMNRTGECGEVYMVHMCKDGRRGIWGKVKVCAHMHKVTHWSRTSWSQFSCVSVVLREVEENGLIALTACDEPKTVLWRASGRKEL